MQRRSHTQSFLSGGSEPSFYLDPLVDSAKSKEVLFEANYPLLGPLVRDANLRCKSKYSLSELAQLFGVDPRTILNYVGTGRLIRTSIPGHERYLAQDLDDFIRSCRPERKMP
jgi:hypothetical protein